MACASTAAKRCCLCAGQLRGTACWDLLLTLTDVAHNALARVAHRLGLAVPAGVGCRPLVCDQCACHLNQYHRHRTLMVRERTALLLRVRRQVTTADGGGHGQVTTAGGGGDGQVTTADGGGHGQVTTADGGGHGQVTTADGGGHGQVTTAELDGRDQAITADGGGHGQVTTADCGGHGQVTTADCGGHGRVTTADCGGHGQVIVSPDHDDRHPSRPSDPQSGASGDSTRCSGRTASHRPAAQSIGYCDAGITRADTPVTAGHRASCQPSSLVVIFGGSRSVRTGQLQVGELSTVHQITGTVLARVVTETTEVSVAGDALHPWPAERPWTSGFAVVSIDGCAAAFVTSGALGRDGPAGRVETVACAPQDECGAPLSSTDGNVAAGVGVVRPAGPSTATPPTATSRRSTAGRPAARVAATPKHLRPERAAQVSSCGAATFSADTTAKFTGHRAANSACSVADTNPDISLPETNEVLLLPQTDSAKPMLSTTNFEKWLMPGANERLPLPDADSEKPMLPGNEKPLRCWCGRSFVKASQLASHQRIHSGEKPYACTHCPKTFRLGKYLTSHMRTHTDERPYVCQQCSSAFHEPQALAVHCRIHTGERPYRCPQCDRTFTQSGHLKQHVRAHSVETPLRCDRCSVTFRYRSQLLRHVALQHGDGSHHTCATCGTTFVLASSLRKHVFTHTRRAFQCEHCGKRFTFRSELLTHARAVHEGERRFMCEQCGRAFSQGSHLKTHLRTHSGERPHSCAVCSRRFARKDALTVHGRRHTGARPFQCAGCGRAFAHRSRLRSHGRLCAIGP